MKSEVKLGDEVYRIVDIGGLGHIQILQGRILAVKPSAWDEDKKQVMVIEWQPSPEGPHLTTGSPWLEHLYVDELGKRVFYDKVSLAMSTLARIDSVIVRLTDEVKNLEAQSRLVRQALDEFAQAMPASGAVKRWQCPWCQKWAVKETKPASGPQKPDGMYACTACQFAGSGAELLRHGKGGYRTIKQEAKALPRKLSNEEMADLPDRGWQNSKVDIRKYYQSILTVWEVGPELFEKAKAEGMLCLEHDGRRYIAEEGSALDYLTEALDE